MANSKSRSKQARRQFRGPDGRFIKPTYIVIDDFGDVSPYSHKEPTFGYAYSITDNPDLMGALAVDNRRYRGKAVEAKASDDGIWNRVRMTLAIRKLGIWSGAAYIDKTRPPHGWDLRKRSDESNSQFSRRKGRMRKGVLEYVIDTALESTESRGVMIVVDEHSALRNVRELCRTKTTKDRTVDGNTFSSSDSVFRNLLQTQDYVANAAGSATKGYPLRAKFLGMKIHRLRRYERIRE